MRFRPLYLCWILTFVFLLGFGLPTRSGSHQQVTNHTGTITLSTTSHSTTDVGQFAGTWTAHGAVLVIARDGTATFTSRTYRWCESGVPQPCDTIDNQGQIHNGNREQVRFSRVSGSVAYGTVISSTFHPTGLAVTLTRQPNDTLLYAGNTSISLLCGPNAPVGTCGA